MRASLKHYTDALRRRRSENDESGFSLIELIVVVVILGVLAAIAVPVFLGLQGQAEQSAQDSIAGSAASEAASQIALFDGTPAATDIDLSTFADGVTVTLTPATGVTLSNYCVTVSGDAAEDSTSGPGC
ncbi:hypothetical protein GCM10009808_20010 [Microbacterium sediminicola]|uniref:Prepilin-type N-terminal cleavage/methylation domain-containing protein n=1 Tax=Microbacterium sediminicola TaxID=415210 RepID=A0ABP4UEG0_9MICO